MIRLPAFLRPIQKNHKTMVLVLGSFFAGAILAGAVGLFVLTQQPNMKARGLRQSDLTTFGDDYKFIDPLIGIRGVDNAPKYSTMQQEVSSYINSQKSSGLMTASVDFRDINEPGGFILNPTELYTPASLNKVPLMMAYFKIAESDSNILSNEITYSGATNSNSVEEIRSPVQLTPGTTYTVEQLIEHMIRYSDNNAADLLTQHLRDTNNLSVYTGVYSDHGIDPIVLSKYTDNMNVKEYSMFIRSLYNATYLNRADSERALKLLSETDFSQGIESGIPNNILVAQKFGEVRMTDEAGTLLGKEINDCGIVYYPSHPYLLCVMTKKTGDDVRGLESQIASISRIVYQNMQEIYP